MRTISITAAFVLSGFLLFAGVAGCMGEGCTERACSDSVRLAFDPPLTAPGRYSIELRPKVETIDGWKISCEVTLPWDGVENPCDDHGTRLEPNCPGATEESADAQTFDCSSNTGVSAVTITFEAPRSVEVLVKRDGNELVRTRVEPSYESYYPNGPACDDMVCSQASAIVPLDP